MRVKGIKLIICLFCYICFLPIKVLGSIGLLFYGLLFGVKGWACNGKDCFFDEYFLEPLKCVWSKEADFIAKFFEAKFWETLNNYSTLIFGVGFSVIVCSILGSIYLFINSF